MISGKRIYQNKNPFRERKHQACLGELSVCAGSVAGGALGLESSVCIMEPPGARSAFTFDLQGTGF